MQPLGPRLAVSRLPPERRLSWGLVIPIADRGISHQGTVKASGVADIAEGVRVLYSTRVDTYAKRGEPVDIVDEGSVIAIL